MANKSALYRAILAEYDALQTAARHALLKRQEEVYARAPRIADIDRALGESGIQAARMVLKEPWAAVEKTAEIAALAQAYRMEKTALLTEAGFPADYLTAVYQCAKCQDTGYLDNRPCICFQQRLLSLAYDQASLPDLLETENFDYFDFRLYDTEADAFHGLSPRENMQQIFDCCVDFAESFPQGAANLLLYGDTGLGKTFLCNCIAREILDKGYTVLYVTAGRLCKLAENAQFRRQGQDDGEPDDFMEDVLGVDLLIIDDLGTEFATTLSHATMFQVINSRLLVKKHTIVSTNLSPSDIRDQYNDRLLSRLIGNFDFLQFFGRDIRANQ